jgi:hypothetical protein
MDVPEPRINDLAKWCTSSYLKKEAQKDVQKYIPFFKKDVQKYILLPQKGCTDQPLK